MKKLNPKQLAEIEYHGKSGITKPSLDAIIRLINFGDHIDTARLLTHFDEHCFLLEVNSYAQIAIKAGFSSGYGGEGPKGLAMALQLLERHGANIDEYKIDREIFARINSSCLLKADVEAILSAQPVRPVTWHDYIYDIHQTIDRNDTKLNSEFPVMIPFGLVDDRITDLALSFDQNPDASILAGYRRLEEVVRERANLSGIAANRLFTESFQKEDSILYWKSLEPSEQKGRASVFIGTYQAFRNRRSHSQPNLDYKEAVREFLLLNELFLLESEAVVRKRQN